MKDTISLTVPMDYSALTRASDMLHSMAIDLKHEGAPATTDIKDFGAIEEADIERFTLTSAATGELTYMGTTEEKTPPFDGWAKKEEPAATEVFADPKPAAVPAAEVQQKADLTQAPATSATESRPALAASAVEPAKAQSGVELDSDGLPWDHRIHALGAGGTHNKLKKTQQWKKKRGVDESLVTQVEAELKATMAAGPANPVVTTTESAPAPDTTLTAAHNAAQEETPAKPSPAPAATVGTVDTFPELMAAITANKIDADTVTAAVGTQGLASIMLLATRPDLIPAVAKALGV